jgi:hypothetical protein
MKTLRVVVAVLLSLALPAQGYAALRLAVAPCPAMHPGVPATIADHAPAKHEGCQPMPCCQHEQKSPHAGASCDSCATCMLSPAFASLESSPEVPRHPGGLGPQPRTPRFDPLALFAIWRPPATC